MEPEPEPPGAAFFYPGAGAGVGSGTLATRSRSRPKKWRLRNTGQCNINIIFPTSQVHSSSSILYSQCNIHIIFPTGQVPSSSSILYNQCNLYRYRYSVFILINCYDDKDLGIFKMSIRIFKKILTTGTKFPHIHFITGFLLRIKFRSWSETRLPTSVDPKFCLVILLLCLYCECILLCLQSCHSLFSLDGPRTV